MSDVSAADEWAKRLAERLRQNPLRRTRGARDFAELEDEIDRLHAEAARLGRILAALREPTVKMVEAATRTYMSWDEEREFIKHGMVQALRAAVAAAEQEVGRE